MVKKVLFMIIILAATGSLAFTLSLLDQIVHGMLYNYGLQFSLEWANPYWNILRIAQVLLGVIAAASVVNIIFSIRKPTLKKPIEKMPTPQRIMRPIPSTTRTSERPLTLPTAPTQTPQTAPTVAPLVVPSTVPVAPPSTPQASVTTPAPPEPVSAPLISDIPGLIRCAHCGKAFTQPLRMLDFQGDRPRIVSICPFCNEILPSAPHPEDREQGGRFLLKKKNGNHNSKPMPSQTTG